MKARYAPIVILAVLVLAAFSTPASAWWWDNGLPLSCSSCNGGCPECNANPECNCTVWENVIVENGSVYIQFEQGINDANYTYYFTVPSGVTMRYAGLYTDVWSNGYCGRMNFTFNGHNLGVLQFGTDGAGCGATTCDTNDNVAGNGLGGNGVWFNVTGLTVSGTNVFVTEDVTPCPPCCPAGAFDGRKRGCNFIQIYSHPNITDTLHIWFNQGMEDIANDGVPTVYICNVTPSVAKYWTLCSCIDCSDRNDTIIFNGHSFTGWNDGSEGDHWMSVDCFNVTNYVISGTNKVTYTSSDEYFHPYWLILIGHNETFDPLGGKDLIVTEIDTIVERNNQTPFAHVQGYTYTINATIKNTGNETARNFNVSLYANTTQVGKKTVVSLGGRKEVEISFNWTPNTAGLHTLTVIVDSDNDVPDELNESNNIKSVNVSVLQAGANSDLGISSDDIVFLPTYDWHGQSGINSTTVELKITNWNTANSSAYDIQFIVNGKIVNTKRMPPLYPMAWTKCKPFTYDAKPGNVYSITISLTNVTNDSNSGNNSASKNLKTIVVRVKDTHEYGKISDYKGPLSGGSTVEMFDVCKVVPENTTLYNLLCSVADVDRGTYAPEFYKAFGIDGLNQDTTIKTYWYVFVNGIPVSDEEERHDLYQMKDGDVAHWDIMKYVNSEESGIFFKPRPIMDYPEPFLHGYNGTVWNITIVYPAGDKSYNDIALNIKKKLNESGVPNENINITTDVNLTNDEKRGNHLILLGTPTENNITAEVNANHTEVGMPVYYNTSTGKFVDDVTDTPLGEGAVIVEACDNPFNNADINDTWMDSNQTIWIATGKTSEFAKEAAEWLINRTCLLWNQSMLDDKGFWLVQYKCGDVDGSGKIRGGDYKLLVKVVRGTPGYSVKKWAGDVDCSGKIRGGDYKLLVKVVRGTPGYELSCCKC